MMKKKVSLLLIIVFSIVLGPLAVTPDIASAKQASTPLASTYTAGIYQSCGRGAWVNLSARGLVGVRFYLRSGGYYSTVVDFGSGQSKFVRIPIAGTYAYAWVSGTVVPGVKAGCN